MILGGYAIIIIFFLFVWFVRNSHVAHQFWKKLNVPHDRPTLIIGNISDIFFFRLSLGEAVQKVYNRYKGEKYFGLYNGNRPTLIVKDPELIKIFLVKDFSYLQNRGITIDTKNDPLSENLFNIDSHKWRNLRVNLSPTFTSGKMKMMFHLVVECAESLNESLQKLAKQHEIIIPKNYLENFTTDSIGSCAFGLQFGATKEDNSKFRKMGRVIFEFSYRMVVLRMCIFLFPFLLKVIPIRLLPKDVSNFFIKMVNDTIKYRIKNKIQRNDFLELLIQLKSKGSIEAEPLNLYQSEENSYISENSENIKASGHIEFTDTLIAAQAFVFFVAGFETSSTTLSFCLYELALNLEIQEQLRREIDDALKENDGKLTYDALQGMKYLDKVISETLRKYPPVVVLFRQTVKPYKIPDTDIELPKDLRVNIPVYAIHRDPKYYPNPDHFDPERFNEDQKRERPKFTYLPFGDGPRNCIGFRFGLLQAKVGLSLLLSKYKFDVCEDTVIPLQINPKSFILAPKTPTKLRISYR